MSLDSGHYGFHPEVVSLEGFNTAVPIFGYCLSKLLIMCMESNSTVFELQCATVVLFCSVASVSCRAGSALCIPASLCRSRAGQGPLSPILDQDGGVKPWDKTLQDHWPHHIKVSYPCYSNAMCSPSLACTATWQVLMRLMAKFACQLRITIWYLKSVLHRQHPTEHSIFAKYVRKLCFQI